jgi:hypothetical protein
VDDRGALSEGLSCQGPNLDTPPTVADRKREVRLGKEGGGLMEEGVPGCPRACPGREPLDHEDEIRSSLGETADDLVEARGPGILVESRAGELPLAV